ncbi:MFS transporter [Actinophytocola sp.]|jgi:MFS family permease|uniref:MFS transporter n=1 Tax=Actinophytocola sp. TaxID=1872138 RepID=UPI002ED93650
MNDKRALYKIFIPLYMSQFLAIGFLFTALVAISRDRGGSLEDISVIFVLGMVWALKFLWAPLVDRFGSKRLGHYRSWLLITQPAAALAIVAIAPFDVIENIWIILGLLALVAILSSTQDIATDALAVREMTGRSRGPINGLQVGAGFVGDIIGGGLVLVLYDAFGWVPAVLSLAALTALPIYFILRHRERPADEPAPAERVRRPSVWALFHQKGAARWAFVLTPLLTLAMPGAYGLLVPIMIDGGVSVGAVGLLSNGLGGVVSMITAVAAGLLVDRMGRKRALILYSVGQLVAIAAVLPVVTVGGLTWALIAIVLVNVFNAGVWTIMYTINMDYARDTNAGSDFTLQVSISMAFRFAIAGVIANIAAAMGYAVALYVCLGLGVVGVVGVAIWYVEKRTDTSRDEVVPATAEPLSLSVS